MADDFLPCVDWLMYTTGTGTVEEERVALNCNGTCNGTLVVELQTLNVFSNYYYVCIFCPNPTKFSILVLRFLPKVTVLLAKAPWSVVLHAAKNTNSFIYDPDDDLVRLVLRKQDCKERS